MNSNTAAMVTSAMMSCFSSDVRRRVFLLMNEALALRHALHRFSCAVSFAEFEEFHTT